MPAVGFGSKSKYSYTKPGVSSEFLQVNKLNYATGYSEHSADSNRDICKQVLGQKRFNEVNNVHYKVPKYAPSNSIQIENNENKECEYTMGPPGYDERVILANFRTRINPVILTYCTKNNLEK